TSCSPFSFCSPLPSRALSSFPTRRSSDLGGGSVEARRADHQHHDVGRPCIVGRRAGGRRHGAARKHSRASRRARYVLARVEMHRSEEHTSELQSLRHLVCRLLLEKKKKRN